MIVTIGASSGSAGFSLPPDLFLYSYLIAISIHAAVDARDGHRESHSPFLVNEQVFGYPLLPPWSPYLIIGAIRATTGSR
jgi:hypothetical protein